MGKGKRVVIVGAGAREHALAVAIAAGGHEVLVAPGNAGTASVGRNAQVQVDDVPGLVALAVDGARGPGRRRAQSCPLTLGPRRCARGPRAPRLRPDASRRAARGLEGLHEAASVSATAFRRPTFAVFDDADAAERHVPGCAAPARREGRRPGRAARAWSSRRAPTRPARRSIASCAGASSATRAPRRDRGAPRRRGGELPRRVRRRAPSRSRLRRITSASPTAIRDRTPAEWAPTRRRPS